MKHLRRARSSRSRQLNPPGAGFHGDAQIFIAETFYLPAANREINSVDNEREKHHAQK